MNPNEVKRLKDWATLPIIISIILFFSRDIIVSSVKEQLSQSHASFVSAERRIRTAFSNQRKYVKIVSRMDEVNKKLLQLDRWIPPENHIPTIIDQIGALAKLFQLDLMSAKYQFENSRFEKYVPRVVMQLQLNGEYHSICGFVQALECLPSPLIISEMVASERKIYSLTIIHMVKS